VLAYREWIAEINFNMDVLNNHISNIAESILLTKLNLIPKFILSENEIKSINEFIIKQNVKIESDVHLSLENKSTVSSILDDKKLRLIFIRRRSS